MRQSILSTRKLSPGTQLQLKHAAVATCSNHLRSHAGSENHKTVGQGQIFFREHVAFLPVVGKTDLVHPMRLYPDLISPIDLRDPKFGCSLPEPWRALIGESKAFNLPNDLENLQIVLFYYPIYHIEERIES